MADKDPNITIDISGNTASMGTDYHAAGVGLTNAHAQIMKMAWGDSDVTERVSTNRPLPVQIQGGTGPLDVSVVTSPGITYQRNRVYDWLSEGNPASLDGFTAGHGVEYLAVAGSTYGSNLEVVAFGLPGATAIAVTGDVRLSSTATPGTLATSAIQMVGVTSGLYVGKQFSPFDDIALPPAGGTTNAQYWPVAVTGGRPLNYTTDSVEVTGSIDISGGRVLTSSTDSVKVYGSDGGTSVISEIVSAAGETLGFSGGYLKAWIGGADINATVNVSSTVGVTNGAPAFSPLRVQGFTAGAGHDPVIIRGENDGAVEVYSDGNLNTNVNNTVEINDAAILGAINNRDGGIVGNLEDINKNTSSIEDIRVDLGSGKVRAKVTSDPPKSCISGSVIPSGSAQVLGNNTTLRSGVNVKNSPNSTIDVVVGGRNVSQSPNNGYILEPGESIFIEVSNLNQIFVRTFSGGGTVPPPGGGNSGTRVVYVGS